MQSYALGHLHDDVLRRDLVASSVRVHEAMAVHLAHIAEFDARRLYAPAGYSCMHAYCVRELRLTPDSASKRIQAARAARRFPLLFPAVSEGRLSLSAVCELAPHLSEDNVAALMAGAAHRSKTEIREFLASSLGFVERREFIRPLQEAPLHSLHAPAHVRSSDLASLISTEPVDRHDKNDHDPKLTSEPATRHYLVQLTLSESAHEKLRYAQDLLSHAAPKGELAEVFERALDALIPLLEKQKFGTGRVSRGKRPLGHSSPSSRYVPMHVKHAVWKRDEGRCTFVSASGIRCAARRFLEFDHIQPVARGGKPTVDGLRLRCRAHNQYEAERIFGAGFMATKRGAAQMLRGEDARLEAAARSQAPVDDETQDVLAGLRALGCRGEEARRAAALTEHLRDASLEDRMRAALQFLGKRAVQARAPQIRSTDGPAP